MCDIGPAHDTDILLATVQAWRQVALAVASWMRYKGPPTLGSWGAVCVVCSGSTDSPQTLQSMTYSECQQSMDS